MQAEEAVSALDRARVSVRLEAPGAVRLSGPDARRFCNGMFTHNVRDLPVGGAHRSALLDDRGRVRGLLWLGCVGPDAFVAFPDGGFGAEFASRFGSFLVFDDVEVEALDLSAGFHLAGPSAATALAAAGLPTPTGVAEAGGGWVVAANRLGVPGWDVWGVSPMEPSVGSDVAQVLRVRAGRPIWPDDVGDKRLVHELGLHGEVLNFSKGCYIGQETVNRVDVMGGVKRRLTGLVLPAGESVRPGASVEHEGELLGAISSVAAVGGGALALAVLKIPFDTPGSPVEVVVGEERVPANTAAFPLPLPR